MNKKWHQDWRSWLTILLLFFVPTFLIGVIVMWTVAPWSKKAKWWITGLGIGLPILTIIIALILLNSNPNKALQQAREKSQQTINYPDVNQALDYQIKSDISSIRSALELYNADNQKYPKSLNNLVPKYTSEIKVNPYTKQAYQYVVGSDGKYTISTKLTDGSLYSQTSP